MLIKRGLVWFTGTHNFTTSECVERRLLFIVDYPVSSIAALDNRSKELLPSVTIAVGRSVDDSFKLKFLLLLAHVFFEGSPPGPGAS